MLFFQHTMTLGLKAFFGPSTYSKLNTHKSCFDRMLIISLLVSFMWLCLSLETTWTILQSRSLIGPPFLINLSLGENRSISSPNLSCFYAETPQISCLSYETLTILLSCSPIGSPLESQSIPRGNRSELLLCIIASNLKAKCEQS